MTRTEISRRAGTGALIFAAASVSALQGQSLQGSTRALDLQNRIAIQHDFTYLDTSSQVQRFVDAGYLVPVKDGDGYRINRISHPYARPEVALFISRLGRQYRDACGEELVVTSLTRPKSRQPRNASPRSVHPTGMALDLRRSSRRACRSWLEGVLLDLEGKGVLEANRERRPPHYHVALFPRQYASYVDQLTSGALAEHRVRRGDTLWEIAQEYGVSIQQLRDANDLAGSRIHPGQVLQLPRR